MAESSGIPRLNDIEAAAQRAKLRQALKEEFRKKISNPFFYNEPGYLFDPAVQRFNSMKVSNYDFFKVTPRTTKYGLIPTVAAFLGLVFYIQHGRAEHENKLRTGQISYKERMFKFN